MRGFWKRSQACDESRNAVEIGRQQVIQSALWNSEQELEEDGVSTLLVQYGLYVESAEKISHRRGIANNFFLLVNSAASVALAAFGFSSDEGTSWLLLFSAIIMVGVCVLWRLTVHSYSQLNSAKWRIVNAMEERLPAAPWAAEWIFLDRGRSRQSYRRLTAVEKWVPGLFALIYAVGFVAVACFG